MNWIFLSLLAPLFWSGSNFIDKYILGKYSKSIFDFLFFSSITSWIFIFVLLIFVGIPEFTLYSLIPIGTGMILLYSYGFYGKALEKGDTSALTILFNLIPVLTVFLGYIFLGQTLSSIQISAFVIILSGAFVISFDKRKKSLMKGFWLILIAIIMWSVMTIAIDFGLTKISFWDYFLLDNLGSALAGLTLFVIPSVRQRVVSNLKSATKNKYLWFTGNNMLDFFGQMSIKRALLIAPAAGLVSVISQIQSFYAIIIGFILTLLIPHVIKEDISKPTLTKKIIGATLMFFGVYLLLK